MCSVSMLLFLLITSVTRGYVIMPGVMSNLALNFQISSDFTIEQQNTIQAAINTWNSYGAAMSLTKLSKVPYILGDKINSIIVDRTISSADSVLQSLYVSNNQWLINEVDMRVNIDKMSDQDTLYSAIIHEFGHALGLFHSEDKSSIMGNALSLDTKTNLLTVPSRWKMTGDDLLGFYVASARKDPLLTMASKPAASTSLPFTLPPSTAPLPFTPPPSTAPLPFTPPPTTAPLPFALPPTTAPLPFALPPFQPSQALPSQQFQPSQVLPSQTLQPPAFGGFPMYPSMSAQGFQPFGQFGSPSNYLNTNTEYRPGLFDTLNQRK